MRFLELSGRKILFCFVYFFETVFFFREIFVGNEPQRILTYRIAKWVASPSAVEVRLENWLIPQDRQYHRPFFDFTNHWFS